MPTVHVNTVTARESTVSAESFRDYIGAGEWTGDTDCQLLKFADEISELEQKVAAAGKQKCHHGFRGASVAEGICALCPNCNARSVFIGKGGYLTCSIIGCSDPGAPHKALSVARAAREASEK